MEDTRKKAVAETKAHLLTVAQLQKRQNEAKEVTGIREQIPLPGRTLEVVRYPAKRTPAPVIFAAFGGGFVMGGYALDDEMWQQVSHRLDATLISVGYRKAPEFQFPSAVEDIYDIISYYLHRAEPYGIDPARAWVYGSSAGANLVTAAVLLDRRRASNFIRGQILNYPYLDLAVDPGQKGHRDDELNSYYVFVDCYLPQGQSPSDPLVSPRYISDAEAAGMPETLIALAGADALYAEGKEFAEKLRKNSVPVHIFEGQQMPHGFIEHYFAFQTPGAKGDYCPPAVKACLDDGSMERQTMAALSFLQEHFPRD